MTVMFAVATYVVYLDVFEKKGGGGLDGFRERQNRCGSLCILLDISASRNKCLCLLGNTGLSL